MPFSDTILAVNFVRELKDKITNPKILKNIDWDLDDRQDIHQDNFRNKKHFSTHLWQDISLVIGTIAFANQIEPAIVEERIETLVFALLNSRSPISRMDAEFVITLNL